MHFTISDSSFVFIILASIHLVKWSTTTKITYFVLFLIRPIRSTFHKSFNPSLSTNLCFVFILSSPITNRTFLDKIFYVFTHIQHLYLFWFRILICLSCLEQKFMIFFVYWLFFRVNFWCFFFGCPFLRVNTPT